MYFINASVFFKKFQFSFSAVESGYLSPLGHDNGGDDVGKQAASAQAGEQDPTQSYQRGIHIKVFSDASTDSGNLIIDIASV